MAGTIVSSLQMSVVNGNLREDRNIGPVSVVQTTIGGGNPGTVTVTTSEGDITIGLTTPGNIVIENLDATNFVEYGPKSGGSMILFGKILPGDFHKFYLGGSVTIRAKADTASVKLRIRADEV
jgi:hypothetical protein